MFITQITGTQLPLLWSHITATSIITDHSDVNVATPQIASLFKVAGEEITGTQRKAHHSGTSGVSRTPQTPSDSETAHQYRKRAADCSHNRCFVCSQLCRRKIDRCKIAFWCFIQMFLILQ